MLCCRAKDKLELVTNRSNHTPIKDYGTPRLRMVGARTSRTRIGVEPNGERATVLLRDTARFAREATFIDLQPARTSTMSHGRINTGRYH